MTKDEKDAIMKMLLVFVELGYKRCEQGWNLTKTLDDAHKRIIGIEIYKKKL